MIELDELSSPLDELSAPRSISPLALLALGSLPGLGRAAGEVDAIAQLGPVAPLSLGGLVSLAVVSIYRGWWVPGSVYREMKEQRDYERKAKERALSAAEKLMEQNTLLIRGDSVADIALKSVRDAAVQNVQDSP